MLSEMAINDPEGFAALVEVAKAKLAQLCYNLSPVKTGERFLVYVSSNEN